MWAEAMRALEHALVCPHCGEQNSPNDRTNKIHVIDSRGVTACDTCGTGGSVQMFMRPGDRYPALKEK
jgi:transcription elongation factor Elf1